MTLEMLDAMCEECRRRNEDKWIPTTQQLPPDFEKVLAWIECDIDGKIKHIYGFTYQVEDMWYGDAFPGNRKVLAWMNLPPAYKGETHEKA